MEEFGNCSNVFLQIPMFFVLFSAAWQLCNHNCVLFDQKASQYQAAKHPASGPKPKQNKSHDIQVPCPSGWWCGGARPHRGFPSGLGCEPAHWLCHPHEGLPKARMFGRYQRSWQPRNSRPRSFQQCCPLQLSTCSNQKEEAFSWSQLIVLQASQLVFLYGWIPPMQCCICHWQFQSQPKASKKVQPCFDVQKESLEAI